MGILGLYSEHDVWNSDLTRPSSVRIAIFYGSPDGLQ
jgi:hypothetical protein